MILKKVLLVYKKSTYKLYFVEHKKIFQANTKLLKERKRIFEKAHEEHYESLAFVEKALKRFHIPYKKLLRGNKTQVEPFSLILSVGGDGTFLEAARLSRNQVVLGVNSSPTFSVGNLCEGQAQDIESILQKILNKKYSIAHSSKIKIHSNHLNKSFEAINDVLVAHRNPAATSRYFLDVDKIKEEQRSSGIWIASPLGSSGAIFSAGGKKLNKHIQSIQYLPRELYPLKGQKFRLTGGLIHKGHKIKISSFMRQGMFYIDGCHLSHPFPYGSALTISLSPKPLKMLKIV